MSYVEPKEMVGLDWVLMGLMKGLNGLLKGFNELAKGNDLEE